MLARSWWLVLVTGLFVFACGGEDEEVEAPELVLDVGSEETYVVGEDVVLIHMTATDPQDMDLEFEAVDAPGRAEFTTYQNEAVFSWDPLVSDVTGEEPRRLVFAVTNEAGKTTERTVYAHIEAGDAGTRFTSSSSQLYDPQSEDPLEFDVRVENDQANMVALSMPEDEAPEGASFEQTDDFEGRFEWLPTTEQRQQRVHHALFEAEYDGDVVEEEVTIIMQDSGGDDPGGGGGTSECSEDEIITHTPLEAQRTTEPYAIEGSVEQGDVAWEEVLVSWTYDDPLSEDPDYEAEAVDLDGGRFETEIPNPLVESGETAEVSYTICAYSAPEDDQVACAPEEFVFRFNAYSPDDADCRDDSVDMSEPERAGEISVTRWDDYRVCDEKPKYHRLEVAEDEEVEVAVSLPAGVEPDVEMTADGEPLEVEMLPCIGLAYSVVEGPAEVLVRVEGDELPYHVSGFVYGPECPDAEYEPNENASEATPITSDFASFEEMAICTEEDRDVFEVELLPGDEFAAYTEVDDDAGNLDLALYTPSQADDVADGGEPATQGLTVEDGDWLSYTAEDSGPHYLSVTTRDAPNDYDLLTDRICGDEDEFAPNHSADEAAALSIDEYEDLKLCADTSDFFDLEHDGDEDISWLGEVRIEEGDVDDVDLTVRDEEGDEVGDIDTYDERIGFILTPEPDQTLELEIAGSEKVLYDLYFDEVSN